MADHVWRWQAIDELPHWHPKDGDGWYVCITCGASEVDGGPERAIASTCPSNRATRIYCRCANQQHAISGAPQHWEQDT